jgi:hypothetical protein
VSQVFQYIKVVNDTPKIGRGFSIWLDEYDDIFSDIDPSPIQEEHFPMALLMK